MHIRERMRWMKKAVRRKGIVENEALLCTQL